MKKHLNNLIERTQDILAGEQLEFLHKFSDFPIQMGCVDSPFEEDIFCDMEWFISPNNGLIQLKNLIPLNILYEEGHNSGQVGGLWIKHHQQFAEFIRKYKCKNIFEIGGAHGLLSKYYRKDCSYNNWTILEPNPCPAPDIKANFIKDFFNDNFWHESLNDSDCVVHSHVLEHIYQPERFLRKISKLSGKKYMFFSVPNMKAMLKNKYTNCLNFEHTLLLTESVIESLLRKYNFELIDKKYFRDDHSIFYACQRQNYDIQCNSHPQNEYIQNKALFMDYVNHYENDINSITVTIQNESENSNCYLFGAHIFSQHLLSTGLSSSLFKGILDNDVTKQGKRLYGTKLKVFNPNILKNDDTAIVVLRAGVYSEEISADIKKHINSNVRFI